MNEWIVGIYELLQNLYVKEILEQCFASFHLRQNLTHGLLGPIPRVDL